MLEKNVLNEQTQKDLQKGLEGLGEAVKELAQVILEHLTKVWEEVKTVVLAIAEHIKEVFLSLLRAEIPPRVVHLARYGCSRRIRKKNQTRIFREWRKAWNSQQ